MKDPLLIERRVAMLRFEVDDLFYLQMPMKKRRLRCAIEAHDDQIVEF